MLTSKYLALLQKMQDKEIMIGVTRFFSSQALNTVDPKTDKLRKILEFVITNY